MSESIHQILKKYWGYDSFRPNQEEIINSVLDKKDSICLLPTGGGKSICYQVPGLMLSGVVIVISPLIALMNDQADSLNSKGIPSIVLSSELDEESTKQELENCVNGEYKFIYLSPERLRNNKFKESLKYINVSFVAIDEAHCISQWGHDFRPSYLRISEIREVLPSINIIALTATATSTVLVDIEKFLNLKNTEVFKSSFTRENLAYWVSKEEDKSYKLLRILDKNIGSSIIYVRNRRKTKEISDFLNDNGISSSFYHAGLDKSDKNKRQSDWMLNKTRVIVATNAFGMGIDKPDVRTVIHMDLADSPEAYFQEAGRAGRDRRKSYAILLYNNADIDNIKSFHLYNKPEQKDMEQVLSLLYKKYRIANNEVSNQLFDFNLAEFAVQNELEFKKLFNVVSILEKEGIIALAYSSQAISKIKIKVSDDYIYKYKDKNEHLASFIEYILRSYAGITYDYIKINEYKLAQSLKLHISNLKNILRRLKADNIIFYEESSTNQKIKFLEARNEKYLNSIISKSLIQRNKRTEQRIDAIINYAISNDSCRNKLMLTYFEQKFDKECGICDYCINKKNITPNYKTFEVSVLNLLRNQDLSSREIEEKTNFDKEIIIKLLQYLLEENKVTLRNNKFSLRNI